MRRFVRWVRALLALGRDDRPVQITMWSDPSHWSAAQRRAFVREIDKGLDDLSHSRRTRN